MDLHCHHGNCDVAQIFLLAALHAAQAPVYKLLSGRLWGFHPTGATRTDGGEVWLVATPPWQNSPHQCNDKGIGPQKLKFLLRFDQNSEYKRPAEAYPLRDFHKICKVCTSFQDALGIKILLDLLKGLWIYGGFNLTGLVIPKFSAPPSGETVA